MAPSPDFCQLLPPTHPPTPTPAPPQAMVGATSSFPSSSSSSLRPFSLSIAAADAGSAGILKGAASALIPRRNGWTSRAVRSRALAHPGLMPAHHHPVTVGDNNLNKTNSLSGGRPASDSDSRPEAPAAAATRAPSSVPVLAITCGAVGGMIALAVVFALVYVRRIRRRVKSMKRLTNVLGPGAAFCFMFYDSYVLDSFFFASLLELAPMSPSQLSHLSTIDSPCVKFDGNHTLSPRATSELTNHLPPLSIPSVSSPTSIELRGIPLSPIRTSTILLSPPPAAKRSPIRSFNPNLHSYTRSPIHSSRAAVPWPLITALSSSDHIQHGYDERNTSSASSESAFAFRR